MVAEESKRKSAPGLSARYRGACTVLFNPEMGRRLTNARKFKGWSQAELGEMLYVSQRTLCNIERGIVRTSDRFTLGRFLAVTGEAAEYILFGSHRERFERKSVHINFWKHRLGRKKATHEVR
jgi:transcriptional regulator with XRE-family HTH domain